MPSADAEDAAMGLVGRAPELSRLSVFVSTVVDGGRALLVTGDPGSGKTALLDAAATIARRCGMDVVQCGGTEFEAAIGFSTMHQLLHRFLGKMDDLAAPYRAALSVALGLADAPPENPLVLASASLELLALQFAGPALVIVDDVQWVDAASSEVLALMSRRTEGTGIGILLARRTGSAALFQQLGLPELRVDALDPEASVELLRREHGALDPEVARRVLTASEGNPLALVELPNVLVDGAAPPEPAFLPLTDRLQRAFALQLGDLPPDCKHVLLLAVLEGSGDLALLQRAAGPRGLDVLEPAQQRGLVSIVAGATSLRLRHPLTGAAVVALASNEERRRAHRVIAEVSSDPDRRAWHAGAAADGPNDGVATALERAAYRWLQRGDTTGAIRAWVRAGRLSTHPSDRARRLSLAASHAALRTTLFRESKDLLAEAFAADPSQRGSLTDATAASFLLINAGGNVDAASALLAAAQPDLSAGALPILELEYYFISLVLVSWLSERSESWQRLAALIAQVDFPPQSLFHVIGLGADPAHEGHATIDRLDGHLARIGIDATPEDVSRLVVCSYWVDRLASCHSALLSLWESDHGEMFALNALIYLCVAEQQMGDWQAAGRHAAAGVQRCADTSAQAMTWQFQLVEGLIAAGKGDTERAVARAEDVEQWSRARGIKFGLSGAHQIRMLVAWAAGDPDGAFRHATAISPAGVLRAHAPRALFVAYDVVEAAMRTGRRTEAEAHVDALRTAQVECLSPRLAMVQLACEAWISDGDKALQLFESALAVEGTDQSPFDLARVHLAFGETLRRRRTEPKLARKHLRSAASIFRAVGAAPWARQADAEIRAVGETTADVGGRRFPLTAQELQIARLAAAGMRNKDIGAELFLSPRTVSAHLYHIFPKLGITSRAALRDALSSFDEPTDV